MNQDCLIRVLDCLVAGFLLVLVSPALCVLSLVVYLGINRGVLFFQLRAGRYGKPFVLYKYCTMSDECDAEGRLLPDSQRLNILGKWLRLLSLDEWPQLWNVIKGDLSLVGPRPLYVHYVPLYSAEQARRLQVPPGVTGWAQINGRNSLSWSKRFELDVWYVDNRSLWLNIKILWRTVFCVLRAQGVSQKGHVTMQEFTGNEHD